MRDSAIVIPRSAMRGIFVIVLLLIAAVLITIVVRSQLSRTGASALFTTTPVIDGNAYQAVFLTNGSTFFGKLQPDGDDWFTLTDVFYLTTSDQSGPQLIKRGNEPQGPREPMIIPRAQVLFIENLRDDGDVVTAIKRFKSGQLPLSTPPPATLAPTTSPQATPAPTTPRPSATPSATR